VRQEVALRSAWRIEGTFREYPRTKPVDCWFRHPIHQLDGDGVLLDAVSEGDDPPWKRGRRAVKSNAGHRAKSRELQFLNAFNTIAADGPVDLKKMANYLDKSVRSVQVWAKELDGWVIEKGIVSRALVSTETAMPEGEF
jgi:hypothetical protein